MIVVKDLFKSFDGVQALNGLNMEVPHLTVFYGKLPVLIQGEVLYD